MLHIFKVIINSVLYFGLYVIKLFSGIVIKQ